MKTFMAFALLFGVALGCATAADGPATYPKDFMEAADAFRVAPSTNRYLDAELLQSRLPVTPVTNVSYTGSAGNLSGRGSRFITHDWEKPSFILHRSEVLRFLGRPSLTNSLSLDYAVLSGTTSRFQVSLAIFFHNDFVVYSTIYSQSSSRDSKRPESDGSGAKK